MSNPISRREFFSCFSRNVVQTAGLGASQTKILPRHTPSQVHLVGHALTRLGLPQKESLPSQRFAEVSVAESCTACGLCSKICPTRAIKFQVEGDCFSITFLPRECLGTACDLCHLICPSDALTTSPGIANHALCGEGRELHRGVLEVCEKCQLPFAGEGMQKLCSICRTEQAKNSALTRDLFK